MTTYGSLFTGVGGFDLGCDAAGWDCAWQVEYDARCRNVLARHWPDVARYDDVRTVTGDQLKPVDVITYGFPCQDLSVAGKRAGLDGERSGLFFEATRIISEMRKATNGTHPRIAVAENVLGLLSADKGAAMARCVDTLAEIGALAIEWRVLDAQWFGVPQRRRRVFLVAVFDSRAVSRGEVFPEPASMPRNFAARNETRQEVAGTLGGGTPGGGPKPDTDRMTFVPDVMPHTHTHTAGGGDVEPRSAPRWRERSGRVQRPAGADVAAAVTAKWAKGTGGPAGDECQNLVVDARGD